MMICVGHDLVAGDGEQDKKGWHLTNSSCDDNNLLGSLFATIAPCPTLAPPTSCATLLPSCFTTILMYNTIEIFQKNAWITSSKFASYSYILNTSRLDSAKMKHNPVTNYILRGGVHRKHKNQDFCVRRFTQLLQKSHNLSFPKLKISLRGCPYIT